MTRSSDLISAGVPSAIFAAVLEDRDPLGDAHDHLHVVLDEEHGHALLVADLLDERRELGGLLRVHARGRLVEEEELRVRRERARDLEPPLIAVRERAGALLVPARQAAVDRGARAPCRATPPLRA